MRKTYCVPAAWSNLFFRQDQLNELWNLIEADKYEEDWRVDSNGDVLLVVDDAMLERILTDNVESAWYAFGAHKGGQKDGKKFFLSRPEHLKGTYIIKGIYTPHLMFVPVKHQKREYFFVQEGY